MGMRFKGAAALKKRPHVPRGDQGAQRGLWKAGLLAALRLATSDSARSCQVGFPSNLQRGSQESTAWKGQCRNIQKANISYNIGYITQAVAKERASQLNKAQCGVQQVFRSFPTLAAI